MKKFLLLSLMAIVPLFASAQIKFATVRLQEIFEMMPETKEANKTIAELAKKYEAENINLKNEYEKKYTDYVRNRKDMPENIRARREHELVLIAQAIDDFMKVAQNDVAHQQEVLMAPIKAKLMEAINAIGAEGGYAFVADETQLLYRGVNFEDITVFVKAKLDLL